MLDGTVLGVELGCGKAPQLRLTNGCWLTMSHQLKADTNLEMAHAFISFMKSHNFLHLRYFSLHARGYIGYDAKISCAIKNLTSPVCM